MLAAIYCAVGSHFDPYSFLFEKEVLDFSLPIFIFFIGQITVF